jgi:DNA-binding response OmpR family regulator
MKQKIVIVEDDKWLADTYVTALSSAGFMCFVVGSAEGAIQVIDKQIPDAIILDVLLPGQNAIELLHELQSYDDVRHIPVLLCTSIKSPALNTSDLSVYGVRKVLDKTVLTPQVLVSAVKEVIAV